MDAAVVHAFGQPPRYEEFPEPAAGEGEAIVQVRAAGLHPIVKALASGAHYGSTDTLPLIPGVDSVGRLDDGTRVYFGMARPPYGTMAERTVVPRTMCLPLPDGPDDVTAAALAHGTASRPSGKSPPAPIHTA
jgi:NADPH:quinone reductase-like Zn-dependent oxidoreductase